MDCNNLREKSSNVKLSIDQKNAMCEVLTGIGLFLVFIWAVPVAFMIIAMCADGFSGVTGFISLFGYWLPYAWLLLLLLGLGCFRLIRWIRAI